MRGMAGVRGVRVAVLGGDRREAEAARCLADKGALVRVWGHRVVAGAAGMGAGAGLTAAAGGPAVAASLEEAVSGVQLVVGPVRGTDGEGRLWAEGGPLELDGGAWAALDREVLFLIGSADPVLRARAEQAGVRLSEYRERDDFAIWNSVPTAEGAVFLALKEMDITLHGSRCLVLGLGRTGLTLARLLGAMGAQVVVVARRSQQLALAEAMGCTACHLTSLGQAAASADVIFNTIPAPVLHAGVLRNVPSTALIIDLASAPGGTDFTFAAARGLRARLAPGLPGVKAPVTAGRILARLVEQLWSELS